MAFLKKNFIFNLINTVTQILFPLITFPYASRVMEASGIGKINFYTSIISYITMFVALGIPLYAVREIARVRNNESKLSQTAMEILSLHIILSIVGYIVVVLMCLYVPRVYEDIPLFLLLSMTIIFTTLGCEWFYQGIEDFKYITIRAVIIRVSCMILLFLLVHSKEDIMLYGAYCVFGSVGNNVFNFIRLRKYIRKDNITFQDFHPFRHLKSVSKVFALMVLSTMYISLNSIILGFMADDEAVGYYTSGVKLFTVLFGIINALTAVMIPHASNIIAEHRDDEFRALAQKLYRFTVALSLPLMAGLFLSSPFVVILLAGDGFTNSILVSQIVAPLLFIVGLSNVFGMQVLYPLGHINIMIKSVTIASIVAILTNITLIGAYAQYGAALAYLFAEIAATSCEYIFGHKYIPIKIFDKSLINYVVATIVMSIALYCISLLSYNCLIMTLLMGAVGVITYGLYLFIRKDELFLSMFQFFYKKSRL